MVLGRTLEDLAAEVDRLGAETRALALLAAAERWRGVFSLFDRRARLSPGLTEVLDETWELFSTLEELPRLAQLMDARVPGERWAVDGLVDSVTQDCANLLMGALEFKAGEGDGTPEWSPFDLLRTLLCQEWHGATDLGSGAEDEAFEARLVGDVRFHDELDFLREALRRAPNGAVDLSEYRTWAASRSVDVSGFSAL